MSAIYIAKSGRRLRVLGNNLLVRMDAAPKETRGGIMIPDTVLAGLHATGEVLAVGRLTGKRAEANTPVPGVGVGDRVLFVRLLERTDVNPQLKELAEERLVRVRPDDILLVLDDEDVKRVQ